MKKISYPINEIFDSIQGEGSFLGVPVTFIRFAGCNLRCEWCDTKSSWNTGQSKSIDEILNQIHYKSVVLTGGEPTIYDLSPLIQRIKAKNQAFIMIETNGTNPVDAQIDWVVCSPKPQSNYEIKCIPNELKYVVDDQFSEETIPKQYLGKIKIWLQPNSENFEHTKEICINMVMNNDNLRLGLQLHKLYNFQ